MSEQQDNSQEKTEEPTPRRLEKAREEGQAARSKELNTLLVLLAGAGGLLLVGENIVMALREVIMTSFSLSREQLLDPALMWGRVGSSLAHVLLALAPFMVALLLAALLGPALLGGWIFSWQAVAPKANRMSPMKGLKRMFSMKSLVELAKAIAKFLVVAGVAGAILSGLRPELELMSAQALMPALAQAMQTVGWAVLGLACSMIVIALVDVPFQLHDFSKQMRMTRQEVKDEMKNTEGKPEVKGRIRQLQMEIAQRRMLSDVPEADVIITNPEHYAVALKYDQNNPGAPVLLAKGIDHMAMRIREVAAGHNIPVLQAPPLARAVYHTTDIGDEIPEGLYVAVAQILAYVFQLKAFQQRRGPRPQQLKDNLPIPPELQH